MRSVPYILSALLLIALLSLSACRHNEPEAAVNTPETVPDEGTLILETDSDQWTVHVFKEHLVYSEAVKVSLPEPWVLPTREDAAVLKNLEYPCEERFVTSDGYTFGMPSASVSKAGTKTKYSVLGLYRRRTVIDVPF